MIDDFIEETIHKTPKKGDETRPYSFSNGMAFSPLFSYSPDESAVPRQIMSHEQDNRRDELMDENIGNVMMRESFEEVIVLRARCAALELELSEKTTALKNANQKIAELHASCLYLLGIHDETVDTLSHISSKFEAAKHAHISEITNALMQTPSGSTSAAPKPHKTGVEEGEITESQQVPEVLGKQKESEVIRIEKSVEEEELYFQSEPIITATAVSSRTVVPKIVPTSSIAADVPLTHKAIKKRSIALDSNDEEDFMLEENRTKPDELDHKFKNDLSFLCKQYATKTLLLPIELLDSSESEALEHFDDESEANDDQSETFFHDSDNEKDHRTKRKEPQHVTTTLSTTLPTSTANVNDIFGADSEKDEQPQMVSDAGDKVKTKPSEIPTVLLSHEEIPADTKKKHLSNDSKKEERKELTKPKIEKAVKDITDKGKEKNKVVEKKEVKANTVLNTKDSSSGSGVKEIVSLLSPVPSKPSESILHTVMKLQELRLSHELDHNFKNDLSFLCIKYMTKKLLLPAHSSAAFGSLWKCLKQYNNNWRILFTSTTASSHLLHTLGETSNAEEGRIVDEEMTLYTHIPGCKVEKLSTYRVGIDYFIGPLGLLFYLRKQLAILVQTPKQEQLQPDRLLEVIEQMIAFEESQFVPLAVAEGPKESIPVEKELSVLKQAPEVLGKRKELEVIRIEKSDEEEELYFQSEPITTTAAVSSRTAVPKKVPTSSIAADVPSTHKSIKKRPIPSVTTPSVPTVVNPAAKKARHIFDSDEEEDFCVEPPRRTTSPINNPLSECQEGNTMELPKKSSAHLPMVASDHTISLLSTDTTAGELVEKSSGKKAQKVTFAQPHARPLPSLSTFHAPKKLTSSWECILCTYLNDSISHPSKCAICKNKRTTATSHKMKKTLETQTV